MKLHIIVISMFYTLSPVLLSAQDYKYDGEYQPPYFKTKQAMLKHFSWLPEGVYENYSFVPLEHKRTTKDVRDFVDAQYPNPMPRKDAPVEKVIRGQAEYLFEAWITAYKAKRFDTTGTTNLPENYTKEDMEEGKGKEMELPVVLNKHRLYLYRLVDPELLIKELLAKDLIEPTGKTALDRPIYSAGLVGEKRGDTLYISFDNPDSLVCSDSLEMLIRMFDARYGIRGSKVEDEFIVRLCEYYESFVPIFQVSDQRSIMEQSLLQMMRYGMTREEALEDYLKTSLFDAPVFHSNSTYVTQNGLTRVHYCFFFYGNKNDFELVTPKLKEIYEKRKVEPGITDPFFEEGDEYMIFGMTYSQDHLIQERKDFIKFRKEWEEKERKEGKKDK